MSGGVQYKASDEFCANWSILLTYILLQCPGLTYEEIQSQMVRKPKGYLNIIMDHWGCFMEQYIETHHIDRIMERQFIDEKVTSYNILKDYEGYRNSTIEQVKRPELFKFMTDDEKKLFGLDESSFVQTKVPVIPPSQPPPSPISANLPSVLSNIIKEYQGGNVHYIWEGLDNKYYFGNDTKMIRLIDFKGYGEDGSGVKSNGSTFIITSASEPNCSGYIYVFDLHTNNINQVISNYIT
jgi:hypothetical protein